MMLLIMIQLTVKTIVFLNNVIPKSDIHCNIGARFCIHEEAEKAIEVWLETPFSGDERHVRRLRKVEQMTDNL